MRRFRVPILVTLAVLLSVSAMAFVMVPGTHAASVAPRVSRQSHKVYFPDQQKWAQIIQQRHSTPRAVQGSGNLAYGGGPVQRNNVTYIIFWGSSWTGADAGTANVVQNYFNDVGGTAFENILTQYSDTTGNINDVSTVSGVWFDTSTPPTDTTCAGGATVEDSSLQTEVNNAISARGWARDGTNATYYVFTPNGDAINDGTGACSAPAGNFCAYHNWSTSDGLSYAAMPYPGSGCQVSTSPNNNVAGDSLDNVGSHEHFEAITDPGAGNGWIDAAGYEIGDKCAWDFSAGLTHLNNGGTFEIQTEYSNATSSCVNTYGSVTNDFSISSSPSSLSIQQGSSGTSTISTAVAAGSAGTVSLSASVSPSGPTVSLSPTSVTAGGSSTLTVNVGSSVATGSYTVTVTGTEGSKTHSTTVSVTVTAPATNNFSISASPTSLSIAQGGSGSSTISTAVTSGSAGTVTLATSVSPSGPTASVSPTSVTAGGSATLTVNVGSSVAAGTYTVTVTGTEGSASHSASVSVTVTSSGGGGGITNGGFETGTFSGWTTGGAATSISSTAHSGSHSAMLGSTSPTNGDSTAAQTFTVPSGSGTLSFWYKVVCPDSVTYDWATATLKDNTAGTTSTVLAKTCSNTGSWVQKTAGVTAGHSYTLTLVSHDDNYSGDPTYTLYDDVALSAPVSNPIVNGGFETGTFSGWTTGGAATSISSTAHSGSHSAMLGSTSPTNGDSTAAQTFTAPSGAHTLTFWYQVVCPDSVTYDWATATLKDNTAGTTSTALAQTCSNSGTWVQVSVSITAGHSYTLTLVSHDDNYSGDPTYTLYDDVSVS